MKIEIDIPEGYYFDKDTMSIKKLPISEVEYVDLGLPSGTLWAKTNVGAEKDIDFGDYLSFESAQTYNCPTREQIDELVHNTTSLWITKEGVNGQLFIGKNGNHIFMPAAGARWDKNLVDVGSSGHYWSSSLYECLLSSAYGLYFNPSTVYWNYYYHYFEFSVRSVSKG